MLDDARVLYDIKEQLFIWSSFMFYFSIKLIGFIFLFFIIEMFIGEASSFNYLVKVKDFFFLHFCKSFKCQHCLFPTTPMIVATDLNYMSSSSLVQL